MRRSFQTPADDFFFGYLDPQFANHAERAHVVVRYVPPEVVKEFKGSGINLKVKSVQPVIVVGPWISAGASP